MSDLTIKPCRARIWRIMSFETTSKITLRKRFGIEEKNRAQISRVISDAIQAGVIRPSDPESDSRRHASYVPYWA